MSVFYEFDYTVDTRDVDRTGCARPSAVLGYLQEAATEAAVRLHVSREETLEKYNCFWMIVRMWVKLERPLRHGEVVTVRTWHRGGKGATSYRDFDLIAGGERVGEAVSNWVLADWDTFKIMRLDGVAEFQGTDGGALCKDIKLHKPKFPQELPHREERPMRYSDTDINGHVNNVRYADFACDAVHMEKLLDNAFVGELQLSYSRQCMPGETLTLAWAEEGGAYWVRGLGPDGGERFDCVLGLRTCIHKQTMPNGRGIFSPDKAI